MGVSDPAISTHARMLVRAPVTLAPFFARALLALTGSNVIVAGTAIFNAPEPEQVIATLKASVDAAQTHRRSE